MNMVSFAEARKARGLEIARSKKIVKVSERFFAVPSQQNKGKYAVDPEAGTCMCPDYETHGKPCKHLYAVQYARHQITDTDGKTVVAETLKISYAQPNWPAYHRAQVAEKETVQTLLKDLCSGVGQPKYKGNGRPSLPWSDVVYGCAMKVYSGMSARRASTDIRECAAKGLIDEVPHYNTVLRYLDKPELTLVLKTMVEEAASPLACIERNFAGDGTGFGTSTYARWHDEKYGKQRKYQRWLKAHAMVGTKTNIITGLRVTHASRGESLEFAGLLQDTAKHFKMAEVSADKAYLSNENLELVEKYDAAPFIPFKLNSRPEGPEGGATWKRLWHYFHYQREDFLAHYHRRSNVEATFSAVKRKFGHAVRAKKPVAQINELMVKALCFNLSCLVHEIHELGIDPKFWQPTNVGDGR